MIDWLARASRDVWIRFGRWMVAALGFQFLEVLLQRDLAEAGEWEPGSARA